MFREKSNSTTSGGSVESFIRSLDFSPGKKGFRVENKQRGNGVFILRDNVLIAASCGRLKGNAAIVALAGWEDATISPIKLTRDVRKNITLDIDTISELIRSYGGIEKFGEEEDLLLEEALIAIHSFEYKNAGKKLTELLRRNRYDYMAWLWYSRIINNPDLIEKSIKEAYRWGNHDKEIWREMVGFEKLKPQGEKIRRCLFCWSFLSSAQSSCPHCKALQTIGRADHNADEVDDYQIKSAIQRYLKAFKLDPSLAQVPYVISVGMFNLGLLQRSRQYITFAVNNAPQQSLYKKVRQVLEEKLSEKGLPDNSLNRAEIPKKAPINQPVSRTATTDSAQKAKTVLVVEDSKTSRKVISMVLERAGLATIEAETGQEALDVVKENHLHLVLLDVMLPDMTGYDVLPQIRAYDHMKDVPVIMLTGRKGVEDRMKGIKAGTNEYLTKPFDPQKLTSIIDQYLR